MQAVLVTAPSATVGWQPPLIQPAICVLQLDFGMQYSAIIVPASPVKRYHLKLVITLESQYKVPPASLLQYLLASVSSVYSEGLHSVGVSWPMKWKHLILKALNATATKRLPLKEIRLNSLQGRILWQVHINASSNKLFTKQWSDGKTNFST